MYFRGAPLNAVQMKRSLEVIMVDDDRDDIEIMREAFAAIGKEDLFLAFDSGSALFDYLDTQIDASHSSVLLLDHNLPGETGEDLLERLGAHPLLERLTFVSFSTYLGEIQISRLKEKGAVRCLTKPSTFAEYVAIARQLSQLGSMDGIL